jgi:hypothetical protein
VGPHRQREERRVRAWGGKWAGVAHAGKGEGERERAREGKERGEGSWAARREPAQESWAAFLSSFFSFLFPLLPIQTIYLNSNKFKSKPYKFNTRKIMLQHEFTNMLTL